VYIRDREVEPATRKEGEGCGNLKRREGKDKGRREGGRGRGKMERGKEVQGRRPT